MKLKVKHLADITIKRAIENPFQIADHITNHSPQVEELLRRKEEIGINLDAPVFPNGQVEESLREQIKKWQFATCPTETKEPFFWKWNAHGLDMLETYISSLLEKQKEVGVEEFLASAEGEVYQDYETLKKMAKNEIINELESNPNKDGSTSPNIQHWIEQKQIQLREKLKTVEGEVNN